jgi:hypothetical protein
VVVVRPLPAVVIAAAAAVGALAACSGPNPASHFCADYGEAVSRLYAAAGNYTAAPDQFAATVAETMDDLSRIRAGAPDEDLRRAFDSAYFAFTVFSDDAALADFLTRADFTQDDVVKACQNYGIDLKPAAG